MLFASLSLKQGIEITLFLWKRVSFVLDLTLEQGRLFPEFWLITNHKRYKRRKWLSKKLIVYEWITVWNWVPIFTIFVWTRAANKPFFFSGNRSPQDSGLISTKDKFGCCARYVKWGYHWNDNAYINPDQRLLKYDKSILYYWSIDVLFRWECLSLLLDHVSSSPFPTLMQRNRLFLFWTTPFV